MRKPTRRTNYNGGNTHLLAAVVTKQSGKNLLDYAREKLFAPLDITDSQWIAMRASGEIDWIAGFGFGGQRLFVVPSLDLVLMVNSAHYRDALQGIIPVAILNQVVLPAVKD